jgi:hypothetical protein
MTPHQEPPVPAWPNILRAQVARRPVRYVVNTTLTVTLLIFGSALIDPIGPLPPEHALVWGFCYGALLGSYVVGVHLAVDFRVTCWWMACIALVLAATGGLAFVLALSPEWILKSPWWFLKVPLYILESWLAAGGLLAILGWWSYARDRKAGVED